MIDQVWSHTSDQHAWFKDSRSRRDSAKSDWYVWADAKPDGTPPNNWRSVFGGAAWTWDTRREQYYLHNFLREQPDLNFHNPDVRDAIVDVARFWLDLGVDGFRLDVCNLFFQDQDLRDNPVRADGLRTANPHEWQAHKHCRSQPENLTFLTRLRELADSYGDICLMGEIFDDDGLGRLVEYTTGNRRLHTAYCFDFLTPRCDVPFLRDVLERWNAAGDGWPTWALGNHDVPRLASRWTNGAPTDAQLELYAAFQICLAGTICLYQGEELGLTQADISFEKLQDPEGIAFWPEKRGRDGCRTPMPWSHDARHAGFTVANEPWLPIPESHARKAPSRQSGLPWSILEIYRDLLQWRAAEGVLRHGGMALLEADARVLAFVRHTDEKELLCVFNFSGEPASYALKERAHLRLVKGRGTTHAGEPGEITLEAWGWGAHTTAP